MTGSLARDCSRHLATACAVVVIGFHSAFAVELRCRDLSTADPDKLLATVDRQSVKYGGGVRVGKYDCDNIGEGGERGCDWETTLEDDRMLDPDNRLIYVLSSHLTGSGSWGDLLVFGCVSGQVKKLYLGQFGSQETKTPSTIFDSAPLALQPALKEYMKHPHFRRTPAP
jgi:hypothetical protein